MSVPVRLHRRTQWSSIGLTYSKKAGNGNPLSRAKAHVKREVDAKSPSVAKKATMMMADIMAVAAATEPVA